MANKIQFHDLALYQSDTTCLLSQLIPHIPNLEQSFQPDQTDIHCICFNPHDPNHIEPNLKKQMLDHMTDGGCCIIIACFKDHAVCNELIQDLNIKYIAHALTQPIKKTPWLLDNHIHFKNSESLILVNDLCVHHSGYFEQGFCMRAEK